METVSKEIPSIQFKLAEAIEILKRTPEVLNTLLRNLPESWTEQNEGPETWSPYDVIGHLIHGERKDWMERAQIILSENPDKRFEPFDRFAQFKESEGKSLGQLLDEFTRLREKNLSELRAIKLDENKLSRTGIHPKFGEVTLKQLLATWTAHDMDHINQITRVMAKQYKAEIGPWVEYMGVMNR